MIRLIRYEMCWPGDTYDAEGMLRYRILVGVALKEAHQCTVLCVESSHPLIACIDIDPPEAHTDALTQSIVDIAAGVWADRASWM